jgi:hypothetical protein
MPTYFLISVKGVKRRSKIARANRRSYRYTIFKSSHHISPPDALGTTGDVFQNKEDKVFLFLENGWEPHNEAPESDPTQLQRFPDDYDLVCRQRTGTWHTMTFLRNANNVDLCGVKAEEDNEQNGKRRKIDYGTITDCVDLDEHNPIQGTKRGNLGKLSNKASQERQAQMRRRKRDVESIQTDETIGILRYCPDDIGTKSGTTQELEKVELLNQQGQEHQDHSMDETMNEGIAVVKGRDVIEGKLRHLRSSSISYVEEKTPEPQASQNEQVSSRTSKQSINWSDQEMTYVFFIYILTYSRKVLGLSHPCRSQ